MATRPLVLNQSDRYSFGISSPSIHDQIILVPSIDGTTLYIGPSTLISTSGNHVESVFPTEATATFFTSPSSSYTFYTPAIVASTFTGDGSHLSNLSFTQLKGTIPASNFEYNSIPLTAISQYGIFRIAYGDMYVGGTVQASNIITSILTITDTFTACNLSGDEATFSGGTFRFLNANYTYLNNLTAINASFSNINTPTAATTSLSTNSLQAVSISTQNLFVSQTSQQFRIGLYDPFPQGYLYLYSDTYKLYYNNTRIADANDISLLQNQYTTLSNYVTSYSNANLSSFTTSSLRASSITGSLNDALTIQSEVYTSSIQSVSSNVTFINVQLNGSSKTVQLPSCSQRPGRILMIKDTQGQASPSRLLILQTSGGDGIESYGSSYSLNQPYAFITLIASPNQTWSILATNQLNSLSASNISTATLTLGSSVPLSITVSTVGSTASTPVLYQGATPVSQRAPLRTRILTINSNLSVSPDDMSSYIFCTNPSYITPYTLSFPPLNEVYDGWSVTIHLDPSSSNFIYINDRTPNLVLMDIGQTRQFVYAGGRYYNLGSAPPYGIF